MKKIIVCLTMVLVLTVSLYTIKSQETFVEVSVKDLPTQTTKTEEVTKKEEKEHQVRIIISSNNYSSIYHSKIEMSAEKMQIYYGKKYENKKSLNSISLKTDSKYFKKNNIIKVEAKDAICWENYGVNSEEKQYEGMFYIYKTDSGLVAVNQLNLDEYVAAVISSEMGESFPLEALKAQAVCARTYIVNSKPKDYEKYNANGDDSTSFQVYNRIAPGEKCKKAAKATKNEIMTYKGKPIKACYFSTSCGNTTNYKIWGRKKLKYLSGCSVANTTFDIDCENDFESFIKSTPKAYESKYPFYRWNVYVTREQVENSVYRATGANLGSVYKIEINSRGVGGIVSQVTVYGDQSQIVMTNQNQIRKALSAYYSEINLNDGSVRTKMEMLPSAFIYVESVYDNGGLCGFKIYGGGFGHGSGMSQNGAEAMAKKKMKYKEILKFFYSGIKITDDWQKD